jgi:SPP1 gp7 family putative phage head morphogenesis protein
VTDNTAARSNLITAVVKTRTALVTSGILTPEAIKRRDRREPGRLRKEKAEEFLIATLMYYWRRQSKRIREIFELYAPSRKMAPPLYAFDDLFDDDEMEAGLIRALIRAVQDGVGLFGEMVNIGLDYTLINVEALGWSLGYGYDLVRGINATTRTALREAISAFVETPGFRIRDVMDMLPFSESRAQTVAVTEITRAYATANEIAGKQLKKEFPDVRVIKTWFTNNDDRVCQICAPLDGKEVDIDKEFTGGIDKPPAHVNCRCWMITTTRLADV